ncbi:MAG: hypothetical protein IJY26_02370 [Clostridia bacterium]|nr:hypothetical protein [Clostridia bacterium]
MKKILSLTLAVCATASMAFFLTSCEEPHDHVFKAEWATNETHHWHVCETENCTETSEKAEHIYTETTDADGNSVKICEVCSDTVILAPAHEHTFKTEWASNEDSHWQACETEGCVEKNGQSDHNFMQETTHGADYIETVYTCDVCAYTYTDRMTVETVVPDEKTWIDAFNELDYTNYTVHAKFGEEGSMFDNKVEISETAAHYLIGGYFSDSPVGADEYYVLEEYYTIQQTDGSYNTYARYSNAEKFTLLNDHSDMAYVQARMESLIALKYNEHYEDFVYNEEKGTYFCSTVIETEYYPDPESPEYHRNIHCTNVEIKVADGAIIYVASDYVFGFDGEPTAEDFDSKLLYDNIGLTVVTLPSGVAENALPDDGSFGLDGEPEIEEEEN